MSTLKEFEEKLNCVDEAERYVRGRGHRNKAISEDASDDLPDDGRRPDYTLADDLAPLLA